MLKAHISGNTVMFIGSMTMDRIDEIHADLHRAIEEWEEDTLIFDLSGVDRIDSSGVVFIDELQEKAESKKIRLKFLHVPDHVREATGLFTSRGMAPAPEPARPVFFERLGDFAFHTGSVVHGFLYLIADTFYYAITGLFNKKGIRRGEFVNQCIQIGMNAFPIVALIAFLIGFILALQSAAQLRQFGASIFVADLIAISMAREMGPLITAIVFAGRSGSSIASEIATMVVTEETDALKSMALNPVRYVLVPKFYAITLTMPILTMLSIFIGIIGALVIGVTYLDIGIKPFYNQVVNALILRDMATGFIKSVIFSWIIVLVGAHYGFQVKGGSENVGKATTASVVASVFFVILADSLLGLIFYFGQSIDAYY